MESIGQLKAIRVPLQALRAALICSTRGIYVHAVGDEYRTVSTDGHRMLVYSAPVVGEVPEWAAKGVVIPEDGLKERLALLEKLKENTALISYATDAPYLVLSDTQASCVFRMSPDGSAFPDYQRVVDDLASFEARELDDMESSAFGATYLREVGAMAAMLKSKSVRLFAGGAESPRLFLFPDNPFAMLILMPMRTDAAIGQGAARVLSGVVTGTVAALRAHQTRWRNKPGKAAEKKVEEYEARIEAILKAANPVPALPAAAFESEADEEFSQTEIAAYRAGLKKAAKSRAELVFAGDVNAIISEELGCTISQLADGVPIDDWFDSGLSPREAADRCADWRRIGSVLPPDEVPEGEADRPIALLVHLPEAKKARKAKAKELPVEAEVIPEPEPEPEPVPEPEPEPKRLTNRQRLAKPKASRKRRAA